ncbi:MAG: ABC transporter permease [Rhodospirillaceae bacterium]|nr:ABC transporter permease [Rhodospirillaceae bacterium]
MLTGAIAISRRLVAALALLLIVSVVVFAVLRAIPADPLAMMLPPNATHEDAEAMRRSLGYDRSIGEQYVIWLGNALTADLGTSIQSRLPVIGLILKALPMTLELVFCGLFLGLVLGIGMGLASFHWRGGVFERFAEIVNNLSQAVPEFLWAILLILGLGIGLALLPFIGPIASQYTVPHVTGFLLIDTLLAGRFDAFMSRVGHLVLPAIALSMTKAPLVMRVLRSSLLEAYTNEYVAAARLRGLGEKRILFVHAFRNAALPTVSLIGVQASHMFGGTLLIEAIYGLPGIGNLMIGAVRTHDLPLIQGLALTYCAAVLMLNSLVDLAYRWLNPRLRAQ